MIITQDTLIKQIAEKQNISTAVVRDIFQSAEELIFEFLTSAAASEHITIKLLNGISLERKYIDTKKYSKGMFQNIDCPEHVNVKASSSRYYTKKINTALFSK